jgi:crossover junction endonuclease MUS81
MIRLVLDTRETQLISLLRDRDLDKYSSSITFEVKQLDIGDIHICYDERIWIIERKTVADLLASIKDGRYKEQKQRLIASRHDCMYLIEGDDIMSSKNERHQVTLSSAYIHTMFRDGIRVLFVKNITDTVTFILTLCAKILDKPEYFVENCKDHSDYVDCVKIKSKKIENITPDNCYIMQLAQIPGISAIIAKKIASIYPSMRDLVFALERLEDTEARIDLLSSIEKIGKEKAKKILEYLSYL